ncbi:MAG: AAA family ATPase [Plectolyngbya sp. WJT66-NPBG17]|jgi:PAS domain S-box-containing protein|nr:AAA family ATPase [Plectolyngbya sp. WJT66-NPBG17]
MIALAGVTVQSKIYESAASLVYRGIRVQDGQAIVAKLLKQDYPSLQELTRYRQEYQITRSLDLEGVIKAYSQQEHQRTLVILLEDFGGESIEHWMQQQPDFCPMPLSNFLQFAIDLTEILGSVHTASVIHKDISPGNIILNPLTGVIKLIDFGIATRFDRTNPTFKSPHVLEGTLAYLSPEQTGRMNRLLDYRTDFYSLGVTFYELLTGQLPFPTTDVLELIHCHIAKSPVPPHELNATIPKPVSDLVLKLMAKNAEDRYQSAWGIKADLECCLYQLLETAQINSISLGLHDISDQFHISQKLYGREAEIAALLAAFERVDGIENAENSPPRVEMMLVSGYAGIGKSALVQELYKPITAKRGYFVLGKFDQLQHNVPYSAIVDALRKLVQQLLGEPDEQVQEWRSRLLDALENNGQLIINVIPDVELIIGKQPPVPEVGATEAQNRFNRVFQKFIRVFCSKEHPLAVFLDDLQWIDSATLRLIELLLLDKHAQSLFLIGAYRDHEVNSTHPLAITLGQLRKQGAALQEISLSPLTLESLAQLLAETLYQDADTVRPLTELVLHKTEGNPFFVGEFLRLLYSQNLLSFDASRLSWQWNITQIQAQNITDNVVELLLSKLRKLPEDTQHILRLAACIGAKFDLERLASVCGRSSKTVFQDLLVAAQAGFIQPISELDEDLLIQDYKFLHDRTQQAAYALINEAQKQTIHLQIGRGLLEETLPEQLSKRLFEIVDHLNHGVELVTDQTERNAIAKLNLMAGQKAKTAIAYSTAQNYLTLGRSWLTPSSWQTDYDLTLKLYVETTEVAYLCGEFEQVEYWATIVLQQAKTVLDSIEVYEVKIQADTAQSQLIKAISTALQVLQRLGISFPEQPNQLDIQLELDTITSLLNEKSIEDLFHLPEMTDPNKLAAMRILSKISISAYIAAPSLMPLLVAKQVNLSIQHGHTLVSPFAYASFGLILCGVVGDIETGYQFGQLALRLLSQSDSHPLKARTLNIVNNFIIHWKEHARVLLKPLLAGYQSGLETGDLEFAAYCAYTYCFQSYANGKELREVEHEMVIYSEVIHQIKQETALTWNQIFRQTILNLMGCSNNRTDLVGKSYNEENELPRYEAGNDGSTLFAVYFNKLFLCYLFSEYAQAVENAALAGNYIVRLAGTPLEPLYYFYDSLARLATYPQTSAQAQQEILKKVVVSQEKMRRWSHHSPMNYLHKYHLVQAETSRVLGQLLEAEEFYEQAIQGARENEYFQEEALAYELAAKFYLERGRIRIAQLYMKEAHYCYERWGAVAKVEALETCYPQFFTQSSSVSDTPIRTTAGTAMNTLPITFDLATVMKASQAISSEIELNQLLHSLIQILIENAGAQTGCLILETAGEWKIEAACEINEGEQVCAMQVLQSIPIANRIPESIIQYVIRSHESVILSDAAHESGFISDPYIQSNQTQSLLCLPLLNQSKLVGVLYLENQLVTGAFTPDRLQVLRLLSTHAAIAIENAKLYSKLRGGESQINQFLEAVQVGIGVLDATGRPYYVNQRGIQLLGKGVEPTATPDHLAEVYQVYLAGTDQNCSPEEMPIVRALKGERTRTDNLEIHQGETIIPIEAWGTPVFDENGNVVYAIVAFQDITERKQAENLLADYNQTLEQQITERTLLLSQEIEERQRVENALRQSEEQRRLTLDFTQIGSWNWHIVENKTDWNDNHARLLGLAPDEVEGSYQAWRERVHPEDIDRVEQAVRAALENRTDYEAEYRVIYPDGSVHWLVGRGRGIYNEAGQPLQMLGVILDISDRKLAEAASILEERNRMAREIHDILAQSFTGILLQVGAATQMLAQDPEVNQEHLEMLEMIDEMARTGLAEARRSVTALRPQLLEDANLRDALHRFVAQMRLTANTTLIYESKGTPYFLPAEVENHLLRIGQEALTNAIKYANASEILVELMYEDAQCLLRIKDDGQGFGMGDIPSVGSFGLIGMSERADRIKAQLTIQSEPGQGTEIVVTVNRSREL